MAEETTFRCSKCGETMKDERTLRRHLKSTKSCIGMWFVCRRCLACFDTKSEITRHQSKPKPCPERRDAMGEEPTSVQRVIRVAKSIYDCDGDEIVYFQNVVRRSSKREVHDLLEVMTIPQLSTFLSVMGEDDDRGIRCLSIVADWGNLPTTSHEKAALIESCVLQSITF